MQAIKESSHNIYKENFSSLNSDETKKFQYELEQLFLDCNDEAKEKGLVYLEDKLTLLKVKGKLSEFKLNSEELTPSETISLLKSLDADLNKVVKHQNISEADLASKGLSDECTLPEDPSFVSDHMRECFQNADNEMANAAGYLEYILKGEPIFNNIILKTLKYSSYLDEYPRVQAMQTLKESYFDLYNNNYKKKEFINSTPSSSENYENKLAFFNTEHFRLRDKIDKDYQNWEEVKRLSDDIMWEKSDFSELKILANSINDYVKVFFNDSDTNDLVADERLNLLNSAFETCQKWDLEKKQKVFGKHADLFDTFLKTLESYLDAVKCPNTTPGNPITHKIVGLNDRWEVLVNYQEQFVQVNWSFSQWYFQSIRHLPPDISELYKEYSWFHQFWLECCSKFSQNVDISVCDGIYDKQCFRFITKCQLEHFNAAIDKALNIPQDFWFFKVNNNWVEVGYERSHFLRSAIDLSHLRQQAIEVAVGFEKEEFSLLEEIRLMEESVVSGWINYTTAVEAKHVSRVLDQLFSLVNKCTGSSDRELIVLRQYYRSNFSFNYRPRIGRLQSRVSPEGDVPLDLTGMWSRVSEVMGDQLRNTYYIFTQKISQAWEQVLQKRLNYLNEKVRVINEFTICPEPHINIEKLNAFIHKWLAIRDRNINLLPDLSISEWCLFVSKHLNFAKKSEILWDLALLKNFIILPEYLLSISLLYSLILVIWLFRSRYNLMVQKILSLIFGLVMFKVCFLYSNGSIHYVVYFNWEILATAYSFYNVLWNHELALTAKCIVGLIGVGFFSLSAYTLAEQSRTAANRNT